MGTELRHLKYRLEREVSNMMMGSYRSATPICANHYSSAQQWETCDSKGIEEISDMELTPEGGVVVERDGAPAAAREFRNPYCAVGMRG